MFDNDVNTNNNMKSALFFYSIILYPSLNATEMWMVMLAILHWTRSILPTILPTIFEPKYTNQAVHSRIMKYKQKGIAHFLTIQIIMALYVQEVVTLFM